MQAYVQVYTINNVQVAAVVCDKEEFNSNDPFVCSLAAVYCKNSTQFFNINDLKESCHLPLCKRGTKTEFLFEKYDVKTEYITMIVRGHGKVLMNNLCNEL